MLRFAGSRSMAMNIVTADDGQRANVLAPMHSEGEAPHAGYDWGWKPTAGSRDALAQAILLAVVKSRKLVRLAARQFRVEVISLLPCAWSLTAEQVWDWVLAWAWAEGRIPLVWPEMEDES